MAADSHPHVPAFEHRIMHSLSSRTQEPHLNPELLEFPRLQIDRAMSREEGLRRVRQKKMGEGGRRSRDKNELDIEGYMKRDIS